MCTLFRYKTNDGYFIGKNYDVPPPCYGLIFWNPAGLKKEALIKPPEEPVVWVSKFGNITFNQVGRDFPAGGMNEKGLVVEQTTLWNTMYPDKDKRKAIKELQLIQYLLDVCSTVKEALERMEKVRVSQEMAKLQYILSDSDGNISLVEFILGEMKVYSNEVFTWQVIANDMIGTSLDYLNIHLGFGGTKPVKYSKYSLDRYVVSVNAIQTGLKLNGIPNAFELLGLSICEDTQWQIVYDLEARCIKWRTKDNGFINELRLAGFENKTACITIEIDNMEQNVYTKERNVRLINSFFNESMYFKGIKINDADISILSTYPEKCKTQNKSNSIYGIT